MKVLQCPQCGANISLDETREFGFCSYCGAKIQINQTIIHKHDGEINLTGVATVRTLCKKGFMEIDANDFVSASKSFDKASELSCDDMYVIIGKMLTKLQIQGRGKFSPREYTKFDEFYYLLLKERSNEISKEEIDVINAKNCKTFFKCYCSFGDKNRAEYILKKFPQSASIDLLGYEHFDNQLERNEIKYEINERYCHSIIKMLSDKNHIDVIGCILDSGCSPVDIFNILYYNAYCTEDSYRKNQDSFYIDVFNLTSLKKLINAGLNPSMEISITKHYTDDGDRLQHRTKCKLYELGEYVSFVSLIDEQDANKYSEYLRNLGMQATNGKYNPDDKKSNGCYIATSVYGSYDCPQVWTLRRYRDNTLLKTWHGKCFVKVYYAISPTLVTWFGNSGWFKNIWKPTLDKIVKKLNNDGVESTPYIDR